MDRTRYESGNPCAQTFASVVQHLRDHGTFEFQTHDRGCGRTERILQTEEQILERVEEEPDISTRRHTPEVGVSGFVVHRTLKEQGHIHTTFRNCKVWSQVHIV